MPYPLFSSPLLADANLKAYWKFDSGAFLTDSKGAFTLTNYNSVGEAAGLFGNCADLGATNTNKCLYVANDLGIGGGAISAFCWFIPRNLSTSHTLIQQGDAETHINYALYYDSNSDTLVCNRQKQNSSNNPVSYSINLDGGGWQFVGFTYDGTTLKVFANGLLGNSLNTSGNGASGGADTLTIGSPYSNGTSSQATGGNWAAAYIDDVYVFNRALTEQEVAREYVAGLPRVTLVD